MARRLLTMALVLILGFSLTTSVFAQNYSFSLDQEVVHVYWNADGTMALDYVFSFTNQPGASPIEFVDVGLPNDNYDWSSISADVDGVPVSISRDYQGEGTGVAVALGPQAIPPGESGDVHVFVGRVSGVLFQDETDEEYASAVFSPTWFGREIVVGDTDLTVTYHLPPGVQPDEPRWHSAPPGFPSEPQTGFDEEGRVTYTWSNPSASGSSQYIFGASFPKTYVPAEAVVVPPAFDVSALISNLVPVLLCGFLLFVIFGLPILSYVSNQRRKLQYMPPKIAIEGHGIKRGLTAVEAAILMEQPLDKVMTMILFGVVKKGAATVVRRDPLQVQATSPLPEGLHEYEQNFLKALRETDPNKRRKALQEMTVKLVRTVSEKMKGFSRRETIEYYKRIMEAAWEQVQNANTPEIQREFFEERLEWTMLDQDYDDRSRRVFTGPVYVPRWWGHYDPTFRPSPASSTGGSVPAASTPSPAPASLPGADFAASVVNGVQTFSQKVIGNVQDFTSRVTKVTNPPPTPTSSGRRGGRPGGGGGCACACACAGCACACAGGGR
jgi:hypothetical protein